GVSDYVFSDEHTQFGFTEVRLGLVPAVISPFCLNRLKFNDAKKFMMSAEVFDSRTAQQIGLVDFVGRMDEVQKKIDELISHYKSLSLPAVKATKKLLKEIQHQSDTKSLMQQTTEVISQRRVSDDAQE